MNQTTGFNAAEPDPLAMPELCLAARWLGLPGLFMAGIVAGALIAAIAYGKYGQDSPPFVLHIPAAPVHADADGQHSVERSQIQKI